MSTSQASPEDDRLLTPAEVARLFNVHALSVKRWSNAGKLTALRTPGGHRRYREAEVLALLNPQNPAPDSSSRTAGR